MFDDRKTELCEWIGTGMILVMSVFFYPFIYRDIDNICMCTSFEIENCEAKSVIFLGILY